MRRRNQSVLEIIIAMSIELDAPLSFAGAFLLQGSQSGVADEIFVIVLEAANVENLGVKSS